jgi:tetraacyldisaccharide 4'-kinase
LSRSDAIPDSQRREIESRVQRLAPSAIWLELTHRPTRLISFSGNSLDLSALRGRRVAAFCGIGNPAGFQATLKSCAIDVAAWLELPDHCAYDNAAMSRLNQWLRPLDVAHVLCTRKDLVKIPHDHLAGKALWALEIELQILRGREDLEARLGEVLDRLKN